MIANRRRPRSRYRRAALALGAAMVAAASGTLVALVANSPARAQARNIVASNYPQQLIDEAMTLARNGGPPPIRRWDFVELDLLGDGTQQTIVAAYSNGFSGWVRGLQLSGAEVVVVDAVSTVSMTGSRPSIQLVPIDGDPTPEIVVSFQGFSGAGSSDWIFDWSAAGLKAIGPVESDEGGLNGMLLRNSTFLDLDGDGIAEAIDGGDIPAPDAVSPNTLRSIYRLGQERFELWKRAAFFATVVRGTDRVTLETFSFDAQPGSYTLRIINGGPNAVGRVHSAAVSIDGSVVVPPCSFGESVGTISLPVTVGPGSVVQVEVRGSPGNRLALLME
jgi:hypothetical protein